MKRRLWLAGLVQAAGAAALTSCASTSSETTPGPVQPLSHVPDPDAPQRGVGLLRRLVVLPTSLVLVPQDPAECVDPCDWESLLRGLANSLPRALQRERGYDVVSLDPRFSPDEGSTAGTYAALPAGQPQAWRDTLARYARKTSAGEPPAEVAQAARELGAWAHVDGIVLLHGSIHSATWTDWAWAYATFSLYLGAMLARNGVALEADIFEAASGRLVWRGHYSRKVTIALIGPASDMVAPLIDRLEPALPRLFTRPLP
jgi:hypothetical protein